MKSRKIDNKNLSEMRTSPTVFLLLQGSIFTATTLTSYRHWHLSKPYYPKLVLPTTSQSTSCHCSSPALPSVATLKSQLETAEFKGKHRCLISSLNPKQEDTQDEASKHEALYLHARSCTSIMFLHSRN